MCTEHNSVDNATVITVADLAASLGGGLLSLAADVPGAEVDDLTLAEPGQGIVGQPGDLVLGVGMRPGGGGG